MDNKYKKHDTDGGDDSQNQSGQQFGRDREGAARFHSDSLRKFYLVQRTLYFIVFSYLSCSRNHISRHSDTAHPVTVRHIVVVESRNNICHLSQRNPSPGLRTRNHQVAQRAIIDTLLALRVDGDGNIVVPFPEGGEGRSRKGAVKINRERRLSNTQPVGCIGLQHHINHLLCLIIVGMDVEQFGVLLHQPQQRVTHTSDIAVIVSLQIKLHRRQYMLIIHLFKPYLGLWEDILVPLRIFGNQPLGVIVARRIDDKLGIMV